MLDQQQSLSAVEKFAQRHECETEPALRSHYKELIPHGPPEAGEQYAFEVDLDSCSGCKACVAACHNLNGLETDELWRNVGLLVGGTQEKPAVQHVTAACHHCLEPACMHGCPVNAYEKDAVTGIVEHLDDQCIGCKYCMFMCPYDVPVYSPSKGIVRKCNMCIDRLSVGEAPACVQSCPHEAIKIRKVSRDQVIENSETQQLVPGAPDMGITLPTTMYKTDRALPANLLPTDYYIAKPLHAHFPLVFMLVLTQASLGIFGMAWILECFWPAASTTALLIMNFVAAGFLVAGLGVAILHLGRPFKAYRAMAGIKHSWLSREIAGFNLFAGAASTLLAWKWFDLSFVTGFDSGWISLNVLGSGVIAVGCSAMLYIVTKRPLWTAFRTFSFFFMTTVVLGLAIGTTWLPWLISESQYRAELIVKGLMVATAIKLFLEASVFSHLNSIRFTPWRHAARLMAGEMLKPTAIRFALAVAGGILLPLVLLTQNATGGTFFAVSILSALLLFGGELLERYLFFSVSVARKMPGAPN